MTSASSSTAFNGFLAAYLQDREADCVRPLVEYLTRFPGDELRIAAEYVALQRTNEVTQLTPSGPGVAAVGSSSQRIDRYVILRELGRGGQGVVYLADDTRLRRKVALKVLTALGGASPELLKRFWREAEVTSMLDHPGICPVYDTGIENGLPYIAMRYVPGQTLAQMITGARGSGDQSRASVIHLPPPGATAGPRSERVGSVPQRGPSGWIEICRVLALVEQACLALHAAHEAGIVHRDIKPGNIMVATEGDPVILDFGMARELDGELPSLTRSGEVFGTPAYMAPEQIFARGHLDRRADVYAMGVTLYECLTLKRPFDAPTYEGLYEALRDKDMPDPRRFNPAISQDLSVVLETALEKDRDRRYASALLLAQDLRRVREMEPIRARPAGPLLRLRRWAQRHPAVSTAVVGVFLLLSVALGIALTLLAQVRAEKRQKEVALVHTTALSLAHASAEQLLRDPVLSLKLAHEALRLDPRPETTSQLYAALAAQHEQLRLEAHAAAVTLVAFAPAGDRMLTAGADRLALLWRVGESQPMGRLVHEQPVTTAVFAPDGRLVATASGERMARLWDGNGTVFLRGHEQAVASVCFAADGRSVATASEDGTARHWDLEGTCRRVLAPNLGPLQSVVMAPDQTRVVVVARNGAAALCPLDGAAPVVVRVPDAQIREAVFAPGGIALLLRADRPHRPGEPATAAEHQVLACDLQGQPGPVLATHKEPILSLAVSPRGDRFLTASEDGTAVTWSLGGRKLTVFHGHGAYIASAVFSPSGDLVLTASTDTTARLFDLEGHEYAVLRGHQGALTGAVFAPRGDRVLTGSQDGQVRLWDVSPLQLPILRGHGGPVYHGAFAPQGDRIITAHRDGVARIWNLRGELLKALVGHQDVVSFGALSPDGRHALTASRDRTVRLWDLAQDQARVLSDFRDTVFVATFAPEGDRFLTACRDGEVVVWDAVTLTRQHVFGHDKPVFRAAFSPAGDRILTGSADRTARLWTAAGKELCVLTGHEDEVRSVAFAPDGQLLLTGSSDTTARLWDAEGHPLQVLRGHKSVVFAARFSPRGDQIVTASRDGTVRLWDLQGREQAVLHGSQQVVWSAEYSPDGRWIVATCHDTTARLWLARPEDLLAVPVREFSDVERQAYAELAGLAANGTR